MPYLNIHWKGYPHHRLPRIKLPSTRRPTVRSRSISQAGARSPQGPTLAQRKKKPLFRIRRRHGLTRSSSAALQTRRRASQRARQNIQVFGWNPDLAAQVSTGRTTSTVRPVVKTKQLAVPHDTITDSTVIEFESTDGAASSVINKVKPQQRENAYSLKPVAKVPVYWTKSNKPQRQRKPSVVTNGQNSSPAKERGEFCDCEPIGASRTYDPRIDPKSPTGTRKKSTPAKPKSSAATRRPTAKSRASTTKTQSNFGDPAFWQAVNSLAIQAKDAAGIDPSVRSIVQSLGSDTASRTPSQRKAIGQFTREISLYLQAARSLPKQSLITSPSATTISAHTIAELKPFQAEFQAAGLAVTSAEQKGMPSRKLTKDRSPPPTPPKDDRWSKKKTGMKDSKPADNVRDHSGGSTSTGTTVVGFTPPHEKYYPRPKSERIVRHSSSEVTEIGFTPQHELYTSPSKPKPAPQPATTPKKRSLPWLQKPDQPVEEPIFVNGPSKELLEKARARERASREFLTQKIEQKPDPKPGISNRSTDIRWKDMKYDRGEGTRPPSTRQRNQRSEMATQTEPVAITAVEPIDVTSYADNATQTSFECNGPSETQDAETVTEEQEFLPNRAPLTSGRSKTFPITEKKCTDHCNQDTSKTAMKGVENKSPRRSRALWKGVDQQTQTDYIEPAESPKKVEPQRKRSSFKLNTKPADRIRTFPLPAVSSGGPVVVQAPPPPPPDRLPPTVPRCTQCDAELSEAAKRPEPQIDTIPEPESEPESNLQSAPRAHVSHACTARSSLQCNQCAPSAWASEPLSPFRSAPDSPEPSPQPSRRSTIPPEETTEIVTPVSVEPELEENSMSYSTLEERFLKSKYAEDAISDYTPVADPIKRPSVPRIRLKSTQAPPMPPMPIQSSSPQPKSPPRPPPSPAKKYTPSPRSGASRCIPARKLMAPVAPQTKAPHYHYYSCEQPKPLPQLPPIMITRPFPDIPSVATSLDVCAKDITDKQVFKGLHVATAAACDEAVDKWIEEITGYGVRKLLADLSRFEGLGMNTLADVAKRAAKQRRGEVRDWEMVREVRMKGEREFLVAEESRECQGNEVREEDDEAVYKDVGETTRPRKQRCSDRDELLEEMAHKRDCIGVEGVRERAVRMGWRERSVSGQP